MDVYKIILCNKYEEYGVIKLGLHVDPGNGG